MFHSFFLRLIFTILKKITSFHLLVDMCMTLPRLYQHVSLNIQQVSKHCACLYFCIAAFSCPDNKIYEPCGNPSQETCLSIAANALSLPYTCVEMCVCPDGMVLEGDVCVHTSQCGCSIANGLYLPVSITHHSHAMWSYKRVLA